MSTPLLGKVLITEPQAVELEDLGPLPEATAHPMRTWGKVVWSGEGGKEFGLWRCEPGPSRWVFGTSESITVLEGSMTVTADGGEPYEVKAGDSAFFPVGWTGKWEITDTVFKVYTAF
jgi:uncharacterized cupin superfamily protein